MIIQMNLLAYMDVTNKNGICWQIWSQKPKEIHSTEEQLDIPQGYTEIEFKQYTTTKIQTGIKPLSSCLNTEGAITWAIWASLPATPNRIEMVCPDGHICSLTPIL